MKLDLLFRSTSVMRMLAMLPPLAATQFSLCGPGPTACDLDASFPALAQADGAPASMSASAQCMNPGPANAPCSEEVRCGPTPSCCGRWVCAPASQSGVPDAAAPFVWMREICNVGGPLAPPELLG
jgi:hypothetical protein